MKNSLLYSLLVSLLSVSLSLNAQCDLPGSFSGNTGANMTVMLTSGLISSLNAADSDAYVVALNPDGLVIGSATVYGLSQTSIAVWGDDSQTPEVDGALANEIVSFQLVDGTSLLDVEMPSSVSYVTNALAPQTSAAILTPNCVQEVVACVLPSIFAGNTGSNMTVMLTSALVSSLNVTEDDAYVVALTLDGLVVGSVDVD